MKIELLSSIHNQGTFDCGNEALNNYLKSYAGRHTRGKTGRTYVALVENEIVGFYTLSVGAVDSSFVPANLPHHPVPVVHLGRLAVSISHQRQGIGEYLLLDAFRRAVRVEREVAVYAVEVIAKDDSARNFYLKYGFQELLDDRLHLYLPMKVILKLHL